MRRGRTNEAWAVGHLAAEVPAMAALPMSPIEGDAVCIIRNRDCKRSVRGEGLAAAARGCP